MKGIHKNIKDALGSFPTKGIVLIMGLFFIFIFYSIFSWVHIYKNSDHLEDGFFEKKYFIFYPALWISPLTFISYNEIYQSVRALESFYANQDFSSLGLRVDFSTQEGIKRLKMREKEIINIFIEQRVIKRIVTDAGLRVTSEEVTDNVDRKIRELGNEKMIEEDLKRLYDWNLEDFKKFVVEPALYRDKAYEIFNNREKNRDDIDAQDQITKAKEVLDAGESFEEVAKKYSQGTTSQEGGNFGWLSLGEIIEPEVAKMILSLDVGEISPVVESDLGYHILLIHETKKGSSGILYKLSQIFIKKMTFGDWLGEHMQKLNVKIFMKGYVWEDSQSNVIFSKQELLDFEKELLYFNEGQEK
ncbi:MAG: hypothetical protein EOM19_00880 [Candidatus Moranbacteria bacterium]|nr:hypothetical protein [Candidatus Moranbacteria bacterium]